MGQAFDTLSNVNIRPKVRPSRVHTVLHHYFHMPWWLRFKSDAQAPGRAFCQTTSLGSGRACQGISRQLSCSAVRVVQPLRLRATVHRLV
jgi:hypothetical protein